MARRQPRAMSAERSIPGELRTSRQMTENDVVDPELTLPTVN